MLKFCPNCGAKVISGCKFCGECGASLEKFLTAKDEPKQDVINIEKEQIKDIPNTTGADEKMMIDKKNDSKDDKPYDDPLTIQNIFIPSGRRGRLKFIIVELILFAVEAVCAYLYLAISVAEISLYGRMAQYPAPMWVLINLVYSYLGFVNRSKRIQDMNISNLPIVVVAVVFIILNMANPLAENSYLFWAFVITGGLDLFLITAEGTKGPNKYGPKPL